MVKEHHRDTQLEVRQMDSVMVAVGTTPGTTEESIWEQITLLKAYICGH